MRPTPGAEPPCGWHSVTQLDLQCCKGKTNLKRILDSKVGSSDLLGGSLLYTMIPKNLFPDVTNWQKCAKVRALERTTDKATDACAGLNQNDLLIWV
jgi:hypothetical protein